MEYRHRFRVQASLSEVTAFHSHSASMAAITPPPVIVRVHHAPAVLVEGDEMDFTMWLGPLPIHWIARIENVTPTGFIDRQIKGPFTKWIHQHTFVSIDSQTTEVQDSVTVELGAHWFWRTVGWIMWLNLPVLFAFRGWKTKRILRK